jgi:hypothetical protein
MSLIYGMFEKGVLRRISEPKTGDDRRLEKTAVMRIIRIIKSRRMRCGRACSTHGKKRMQSFCRKT